MGHERIGYLPKTQRWVAIIEQLSNYDSSSASVALISLNTLNNIKKTYEAMPYNESVIKAIKYLATLSVSAKQEDQAGFLRKSGIVIDDTLSLLTLIRSAKNYIKTRDRASSNYHEYMLTVA